MTVRPTLYASPGLTDKLYWRRAHGRWHCFKKTTTGRHGRETFFTSLCGRYELDRSGGQACNRPPPYLRCGLCDGREAKRRGKEESMPDSPDFDPERYGLKPIYVGEAYVHDYENPHDEHDEQA